MAENNGTEQAMAQLAQRLASVEQRLAEIELRQHLREVPPPISMPPPFYATNTGPRLAPRPQITAEEAELQFGRQALPIVGALSIGAGLVFLTSWLIQHGMITRPLQFALSILATFLLLGAGQFAKTRQPALQPILTGLGSLAAYLTAAGGHFTFGVYGGPAMIAAFFAVAAANLAYGSIGKQPVFAGIGTIGGMIAAGMAHENVTLSITLAALAFTASAFVARAQKQRELTWLTFVTYLVASLVWADNLTPLGQLVDNAKMLLWLIPALVTTFLLHDEEKATSVELALPGLLASSVPLLLTFITRLPEPPVSLGFFVYALPFAAATWLRSAPRERAAYLVVALLIGGIIAPAWLPQEPRIALWFIGGAALCLIPVPRSLWLMVAMGTVYQAFSIEEHLANHPRAFGISPQVFYCLHLAVHLWAVTRWLRWSAEVGDDTRLRVDSLTGLGLTLPLMSVTLYTLLLNQVGLASSPSITICLASSGFVGLVAGYYTQRLGYRYAAWTTLLAAAGKFVLSDLAELDLGFRIAILILAGVVAMAVSTLYLRRGKA